MKLNLKEKNKKKGKLMYKGGDKKGKRGRK